MPPLDSHASRAIGSAEWRYRVAMETGDDPRALASISISGRLEGEFHADCQTIWRIDYPIESVGSIEGAYKSLDVPEIRYPAQAYDQTAIWKLSAWLNAAVLQLEVNVTVRGHSTIETRLVGSFSQAILVSW
jgi:hypothetical protein